MLKPAYLATTSDEINKLINEGEYPYLNLMGFDDYELVELEPDQSEKLQYVSINEDGKILGYFAVSKSLEHNKFYSSVFIKFKYTYDICGNDTEEAFEDFYKFQKMLFFNPIFTGLEVRSVVDNPANKLYEKWLDLYDGKRILFPKYVRLKDGKYYDCYLYWFERRDNEE